MTTHTTLSDLMNKLIQSETLFLSELVIKGTIYYGIVLVDKTAIVPYGYFYELYNPHEYEIKSEVKPC